MKGELYMKSKKSTVLILVTIIIAVLIICTMFIVRNTIAKEEIKSEVISVAPS